MEKVSLTDIKKELAHLSREELMAVCLRMAKYKKDSKELLHYLLFEAGDEPGYIEQVKEIIAVEFKAIDRRTVYKAKKGAQRNLRILKKYIRYSGLKQTEAELLLFFCAQMREAKLPIRRSTVLLNMYVRQLNAIEKALKTLHADLQYDYKQELEAAREAI